MPSIRSDMLWVYIVLAIYALICLIICILIHAEGGTSAPEIDQDTTVADLLLLIFIFNLAWLYATIKDSSPFSCVVALIKSILDYKPFKKRK
jgi:hypothetical protein